MSHRFGSTCALFLLSALPATALAGESSDPGPVLVETILDKEVGGLDAGGHWLDARASEPVSYEGKESSSKQSGPGGGTTTLYGEFLNADLDSVKNTYGVGFTGSGDGYLAKVSSGGQLLWDIDFTSAGEVVAHDVTVNQDDDLYVAVTSYFPTRATATQARCSVYKIDGPTGFVLSVGSINSGANTFNECTRVFARDSMDTYYTGGFFGGSGWMIIGYGYYGMNQLPHQSYYGGWNDVYEIVDINEDVHGNLFMAINTSSNNDADITVITYKAGVLNPYPAATRLDYGGPTDEDVATGFTVDEHGLPHLAGVSIDASGVLGSFHKQISRDTVGTRTEATREP